MNDIHSAVRRERIPSGDTLCRSGFHDCIFYMIVFKQTLLPVGTVPARLCRQRRLERQEGKPFTGSCEPRIVMGNIRGSDPKQVKTCFGFFVFTKAPQNKRTRVPAADSFAFPLFFRPFPLFFVLRGIELPAGGRPRGAHHHQPVRQRRTLRGHFRLRDEPLPAHVFRARGIRNPEVSIKPGGCSRRAFFFFSEKAEVIQ